MEDEVDVSRSPEAEAGRLCAFVRGDESMMLELGAHSNCTHKVCVYVRVYESMNGRFPAGKLDPDPRKWKREKGIQEREKGLGWGSFFLQSPSRGPRSSRVQYGVEDGTAFQGPSDRPSVPTSTRVRAEGLGHSSGTCQLFDPLPVNECMSERATEGGMR